MYATKGKETITRVLSVSVPANLFQRVASPACAGAQSLFYRFVAWRSQPIDSPGRAFLLSLPTFRQFFLLFYLYKSLFPFITNISKWPHVQSHPEFFSQPANKLYAATLGAEVIYNLLPFFLRKALMFSQEMTQPLTHMLKLLSANIRKLEPNKRSSFL